MTDLETAANAMNFATCPNCGAEESMVRFRRGVRCVTCHDHYARDFSGCPSPEQIREMTSQCKPKRVYDQSNREGTNEDH